MVSLSKVVGAGFKPAPTGQLVNGTSARGELVQGLPLMVS